MDTEKEEVTVRYQLSESQRSRLEHWHYHGNVADVARFDTINDVLKRAAETIMRLTPSCRQQSTALAELESARMWANSAIAVHECMMTDGTRCKN